jgi:cytosine/adenosine deaminase-related metal-dependent hydrolase
MSTTTFKARYAFPVCSPPLADAVVTVHSGRIAYIGQHDAARDAIDLGNAAIVPALVNAHTHLEFSDLRAPIGSPGMALPTWISHVVAHRVASRSQQQPEEMQRYRRDVLMCGVSECLQGGSATIGEIATGDWPHALLANPCATVCIFLELIGLAPHRVELLLQAAREYIRTSRRDRNGQRIGISPHAPYTVHPELLSGISRLSHEMRFPVAMHLAESEEELQLLDSGDGPFIPVLSSLDAWHPDSIPPGTRPLDYLKVLAQAHRALVIHGNYLNDADIAFLSSHRQRISVVYCPRTHAYFGHAEYPLRRLQAAGVNVALGTDSRASNPNLSLWAEMQWLHQHRTDLAPADLLRMGTVAGARALGMDSMSGTLQTGACADFVVLRLPDKDRLDPHQLLFDAPTSPVATFRRGVPQLGSGFGQPH